MGITADPECGSAKGACVVGTAVYQAVHRLKAIKLMHCDAAQTFTETCSCAGGGNWTIKSTSRKTPLTSPERQPQATSRPGTLKKPGFNPERGPGTQRRDADQAPPPVDPPETQKQSLRPGVARPLGGWQQYRGSEDGPRASFFETPQISTQGQ